MTDENRLPTETPAGTAEPGRHVLIVDDDTPIRGLLRQVLRRMGLESMEARDGVEALSALGESMPRLMLLDLMMPRMSGWEVLDSLKADGLLETLPVIVLTAVGSQRTENLPSMGVRAVLSKPFEIQELIKVVERILGENETENGK